MTTYSRKALLLALSAATAATGLSVSAAAPAAARPATGVPALR